MKNISLALNVLLLIAVGFLYYKVYSTSSDNVAAATVVKGKAAESKMVFLNSDSLMGKYDLFKAMQAKMENKRDSLDRVLTARGKALENEVADYQEKAQMMTDADRQAKEEALTRKQQEILASRDALLEQLKKEEDQLTDSIHADLIGFLKKFNRDKGYDFILGYSRGGGILLANDSLDVTKQVIQGLNASGK